MTKEIYQNNILLINDEVDSCVRDYFTLLKPRVISLVVLTGITGLLLAPGHIHPLLSFISILCIALGSGAAGAINMWYERDIDKIMSRTKMRPIPLGKIKPEDALHFGVALSIISIVLMGLVINIFSAVILSVAILFYIVIYTIWLKRRTTQNIVIGGAAGAFPPIIGWVSVTNSITIEPIILFLIIFMWTPPHFWALSLYKSKDYQKVGIPMLPVIKGITYTKIQILIYSLLLSITSLVPFIINMSGKFYFGAAVLLSSVFNYYSYKLYKSHDIKEAPKVFSFSIIYLFLLFLALIIDNLFRSF